MNFGLVAVKTYWLWVVMAYERYGLCILKLEMDEVCEIRLYIGFALDLQSICLDTSDSSPRLGNSVNCLQSSCLSENFHSCATDDLLYRVGVEHIKVFQPQQFGRGYGSEHQLPIIDV